MPAKLLLIDAVGAELAKAGFKQRLHDANAIRFNIESDIEADISIYENLLTISFYKAFVGSMDYLPYYMLVGRVNHIIDPDILSYHCDHHDCEKQHNQT